MTDSPAPTTPLDPNEQPIFDALRLIREELSLLKSDKSTYIRSDDVFNLYHQVIDQVHLLNRVREDHGKPREQNQVDSVLEDCFQLISLFYMTIGRNNEAPASYAMSSTMKRLLTHLRQVGFYSAKDLDSIDKRIEVMRENLKRGEEKYSPQLITLLSNRLDANEAILKELKEKIPNLCDRMSPVYEKLVSILRSMAAANTRCCFPRDEMLDFQQQLKEMQKCVNNNGKWVDDDGSIPRNHHIVVDLLDRVVKWSDIVLEKEGKVNERFMDLYNKLREIRGKLEKLTLTQAWSMRETDLYSYQRQLDRIDESRVNGNFLDAEGKPADLHAQRTLLYLIRRSYAYIWTLILLSEPVSEALLPTYNQLNTLRKCLEEVKKSGGVSSMRELYPYGMKVNSIDNMRVDGKFYIGNDIPEGQGSVTALLSECYELLNDLREGFDDGTNDDGEANGDADGDTDGDAKLEVKKESKGDTKEDVPAAINGETRGKEERASQATESTK